LIRYPERYRDPRGEGMWVQVWAIIKRSGMALDLSTGGQGVLQP
jgi:hypothetical protein